MLDFLKKYHKWLAIVISLFIILFSISGIVLNHRGLLSSLDVNRKYLPAEYKIINWNNAAVKSTLKISEDSIFIFGNIGIWKTDSKFDNFTDFNNGLPNGIDNRKVCSMLYTSDGRLFTGTLFGLYEYSFHNSKWTKKDLPTHEQRVVDLLEKDNKLLVLMRSNLLISDFQKNTFDKTELPKPENYDNKIGLFKTLWVIHSGEIYGDIGKIIVDLVGLIFIFLTITGLIIFINKLRINKRINKKRPFAKLKNINIWNLKWHNKIGWITFILLIITTSTGMFLRPPLLIAIANVKVGKIPGTELSQANPWFDKLRRIMYDEAEGRFMIATLDGIFYSDDEFKTDLKKYKYQPPVSVMGVNVFKKHSQETYLIGSFEGLFEWNPSTGMVMDYIIKEPYVAPVVAGPPIGEYMVAGYSEDFKNQEIIFDYNPGAININKGDIHIYKGAVSINEGEDFPIQSKEITDAYRMSWWNLALEIHTARIYKIFFGKYYILFIPLAGFIILFILISGLIVWWKLHRN